MNELEKNSIVLCTTIFFRLFGPIKNRVRDCVLIAGLMTSLHLIFTQLEASEFDIKKFSNKELATYLERREDALVPFEGIDLEWNPSERDYFVNKINFHEANAKRTYEDAKEKCWWLPSIDYRMKARHCFMAIIASSSPNTAKSRLVFGLLALLQEYGLAVIDEWYYIEDKLDWSQWHYEQKEYYEHLLIKEMEP